MGHLINPTCFRLGKSVDWKSKWVVKGKNAYRGLLQDDLLIYKYLTIFFKKYTIPGYSKEWQRKTTIEISAGKRLSGKHNIIENPFGEVCKLLISHVKIIRGKRLIIRCEFFDAKFEIYSNNLRSRTRARYSWEYIYKYIVSKDESIDRNWYRPFTYSQIPKIREESLKDLSLLKMDYRIKWLKGKWKKKPIRTLIKLTDMSYQQMYIHGLEDIMKWLAEKKFKRYEAKKVVLSNERLKKISYRYRRLMVWARKKFTETERAAYLRKKAEKEKELNERRIKVIQINPLYKKRKKDLGKMIIKACRKSLECVKEMEKLLLIRSYFLFREETYEQMFENIRYFPAGRRGKNGLITKILLKTIRIWGKLAPSKKIYYVILLRNLLISIINTAELKVLRGKITMSYLRLLNLLTYVDFSYQYMVVNKYTLNHINNYFIFSKSSNIIRYSLGCIDKNGEVDMEYMGFGLNKTTASLIVNYIIIHLKKYFKLSEILRPLIRELKSKNIVRSYRIQVAGRLTRKQRAWYSVNETEGVSYSKKMVKIDYAQDKTSLKFGAVGVKVWLVYTVRQYYKYNLNKYLRGLFSDLGRKQFYYKYVFRYGEDFLKDKTTEKELREKEQKELEDLIILKRSRKFARKKEIFAKKRKKIKKRIKIKKLVELEQSRKNKEEGEEYAYEYIRKNKRKKLNKKK